MSKEKQKEVQRIGEELQEIKIKLKRLKASLDALHANGQPAEDTEVYMDSIAGAAKDVEEAAVAVKNAMGGLADLIN